MASYYHLFPFGKVPQGARLLLYGAGEVGQWYLQQMRQTGYASVLAIADRDWDRYGDLGVPLIAPETICEWDYDYVLISIENPDIACKAKLGLINTCGVEKGKILLGSESLCAVPKFLKPGRQPTGTLGREIPVSIWSGGGLGDCLILKRRLDEVMAWDRRIRLDLYVLESMLVPMHSFCDGEYGERLRAIIPGHKLFEERQDGYALCMAMSTDLDVLKVDETKFEGAPVLLSRILQMREQSKAYGMFHGCHRYIHYARCAMDGLDCYRSFNRYTGFHVEDYHTHIPLRESWEMRYATLGLSRRYITVNCGFDPNYDYAAKTWPMENFVEFVVLFKQSYPDVQVIQVGGAGLPEIEGCDRYFLGENLELVKYLLRGAMFHLDIEGGLVHLASQLDTKCVVLFGPTPIAYYGYQRNVNIRAGECHGCCWLENDFQQCYRRMEKPECMYAITPELVMERITSELGEMLKTQDVEERRMYRGQ